jgi:hypothetical protein
MTEPVIPEGAQLQPCGPRERELFGRLYAAHEQTLRDLRVAFDAFACAHGVPGGAELVGTHAHGLVIRLPASE